MRVFFSLFLITTLCFAAPMQHRELDLLIRMGTPDAQILAEVKSRKLIAPLDTATQADLAKKGASASLLSALKNPAYSLSAEQTAAEVQRIQSNHAKAQAELAAFEEAKTARLARDAEIGRGMLKNGSMSRWLEGKMIRKSSSGMVQVSSTELKDVKLYAIYASASWCGPCRKFTPKLIQAYRELKTRYPEFELVLYCADKTQEKFDQYVRDYDMPWPCVRYGEAVPEIERYIGDSIPWLVGVAGNGEPISKNAVDKSNYIAPEEVLSGLAETLIATFGKR